MAVVHPSAEMTYIRYVKDKGMLALIAWFRAELALQDEDTQKRLGGHSDEYLAENQNSIVYLAKLWRDKRLPVADAVAVA